MKHDHKLKLQENILQTCIRAVNARCNHQMPTSIFGEIKQDLQLQPQINVRTTKFLHS